MGDVGSYWASLQSVTSPYPVYQQVYVGVDPGFNPWGPPKPKKKIPDLHSMKLNHLPDNLRKLADEVLKDKFA